MYTGVTDALEAAKEANSRVAEGSKKAGMATATAREFGLLEGGPFKPTGTNPASYQTLAGKRAEQAGAFVMHMPKEMTPRFSAVEEASKNFQMGALKDPLEQQKLQWERENNEAMARTIPQILREIRGNTKGGPGLP